MHLIAIQMQSYEIAVGFTSKPRLTHISEGFFVYICPGIVPMRAL